MRIVAFLPSSNSEYLRRMLPVGSIVEAMSWGDLERQVTEPGTQLALIDPAADGVCKTEVAARVVRNHRGVPFVGYMPLNNQNIKAVLVLSQHGLANALLHPLRNEKTILFLADQLSTRHLGYELLGFVERRVMAYCPQMWSAIKDLLERPHRYDTVGDLGRESSLSTREVYRLFERTQLGSPRKFIIGAKLLLAYTYLRSGSQVRTTAKRVGCSTKMLVEKTSEVFGCTPSHLGREGNAGEILIQVVEWIYKPPRTFHRSNLS